MIQCIHICNDLIKGLNKNRLYSYYRNKIILFDTDIIHNKYSETKIDSIDYEFKYHTSLFKNKDGNILHFWNKEFD